MKIIKVYMEIRIPLFNPGGIYLKIIVFLPLLPFTAIKEIFALIIGLSFPLTVAENPESYGH